MTGIEFLETDVNLIADLSLQDTHVRQYQSLYQLVILAKTASGQKLKNVMTGHRQQASIKDVMPPAKLSQDGLAITAMMQT